jgi:mannose-1-phosphate guanylyltransferase/mannose-6-phosphate isomerase
MSAIVPVILSGGSGTRLWPLSRAMYPKQFIRFFDDQASSLLATTLKRLGSEAGFAEPIVVCNNDHRFLVKEEVERAGVSPRAIVLEPAARNTAPAAAIAALMVARDDPAGILALMPSDHAIKDEPGFVSAVLRAAEVAGTGRLVLFGITPSAPHTGYGYIRRGAPLAGFAEGLCRRCFHGKARRPHRHRLPGRRHLLLGTAASSCSARAPSWRSWPASSRPSWTPRSRRSADAQDDLGFLRLGAEAFARAPAKSIDYAVMEHTGSAAVLPVDIGWSDVGSWSSAVGARRARCRRQRRKAATRCWNRRPTHTSIPSARSSPPSASRTSSSSTPPMRCWWPIAPRRRT